MVRTLLLLIACLLTAAPSVAQTNPVPAGQPFTVGWDANPAADNVTVYRCYVDKVKVGQDIPAATRQCAVPGQSAGQHVVEVSAVNVFGEGSRGSLTATAGNPPSAPGNLRITTVQTATLEVTPDGRVTILASELTASAVQ